MRLKTGGAYNDGEPHELQRSHIMGSDLGGTCITEVSSYDGEGEGGVCTLVGEPQNLLIATIAGWEFVEFFLRMAPITMPVFVAGIFTCFNLFINCV